MITRDEVVLMAIRKVLRPVLKNVVGTLALSVFPNKAKLIENTDEYRCNGLLDRIIWAGLIRNARSHDSVSHLHNRFWMGAGGTQFVESHGSRFENWFLVKHFSIVIEIEKLIASDKRKYNHVVEIGCGDGQVINYLSGRLKNIESFTGVDINEDVIALNNQRYRKRNLKFACGETIDWVCRKGKPGSIFISNGGVLEYFSAKHIAELIKKIAGDLKPSAFAFIEPLAMKYNLEMEKDSRPYGTEWSFSHNYKSLFESHGFNTLYQHETVTEEKRWLLMLLNTPEAHGVIVT